MWLQARLGRWTGAGWRVARKPSRPKFFRLLLAASSYLLPLLPDSLSSTTSLSKSPHCSHIKKIKVTSVVVVQSLNRV